uniref:Cohesin loading complex subunit SCC4 homolog n=1 Tax=Ciona savignyi TaxID=51511 RepID=H2ZJZ6_CIOSA
MISTTVKSLEENPTADYYCFRVAENIRAVAEHYIESLHLAMAVFVVSSAAKLFHRCTDKFNGPKGILNCMHNMQEISQKKHRTLFMGDLVEKRMMQLLEMIRSFEGCDLLRKASLLGRAHIVLGNYFKTTDNSQSAKDNFVIAIQMYEDTFKDNAKSYSQYGICTHNLAACIAIEGQLLEAEKLLIQAIGRL